MPTTGPWSEITRPVSAWNKPINADFKALFKSLTKAAADGALGKWAEAGADAAEALSALGLRTDPPQLAWVLLRRALEQAVRELVAEHADTLQVPEGAAPDDISDKLDLSIEEAEVTVDPGLFEHPGDLPLLQLFAVPFREWLVRLGMAEGRVGSVVDRLMTYFIYSLQREWGAHPQLYEPIRGALETPFAAAAGREWAWQKYAAHLDMQLDRSMLRETFGIRQVYVRLRAYYDVKNGADEKAADLGAGGQRKVRRRVVDLHDELRKWLDQGTAEDAVRVVSGGPGRSWLRTWPASSTSWRDRCAAGARGGPCSVDVAACSHPPPPTLNPRRAPCRRHPSCRAGHVRRMTAEQLANFDAKRKALGELEQLRELGHAVELISVAQWTMV